MPSTKNKTYVRVKSLCRLHSPRVTPSVGCCLPLFKLSGKFFKTEISLKRRTIYQRWKEQRQKYNTIHVVYSCKKARLTGEVVNWLKLWGYTSAQWSFRRDATLSIECRSLICFQRILSFAWLCKLSEPGQTTLSHSHSQHAAERQAVGPHRKIVYAMFKSQFHHLLATSLWKSYFTYLCPSMSLSV